MRFLIKFAYCTLIFTTGLLFWGVIVILFFWMLGQLFECCS